jgi:hypothetical protein
VGRLGGHTPGTLGDKDEATDPRNPAGIRVGDVHEDQEVGRSRRPPKYLGPQVSPRFAIWLRWDE